MEIFAEVRLAELVSTIVYTGVGVALMYVCWLALDAITPFSLRKEITEGKNLALAVVVGAIFIAIALIIAAVLRS